MIKTGFHSIYRDSSGFKTRPQTSMTRQPSESRLSGIPLHRRIRRAFKMETVVYDRPWHRHCLSNLQEVKLDSQQPETIYNWLDEFENTMTRKSIGTPFEYPMAKYQQSIKLVDSKGYRKVKQMQRHQSVPIFAQKMRSHLRKIQERKLQLTQESPERKTFH